MFKHETFWIVSDAMLQGVLLGATMRVVRGYFDDFSGAIIAAYVASVILVRMLFSGIHARDNMWLKLVTVGGIVMASGLLVYETKKAQANYYQTHVIQDRVGRIIEEVPAYMVSWNTKGIITEASANINLLTGYYRAELIGEPMTMLLRKVDQKGFGHGMLKAGEILRKTGSPDAGWLTQGIITFGLLHRNGRIVPVKAWSWGIRWSQDIQFQGDTDLYAVFVPVDPKKDSSTETTIDPKSPVQVAPPPPPTKTIVPSEAK